MEDPKNFDKWSTISRSCKLQVLSKNEIILPACDGKATFAQMKESRMYGFLSILTLISKIGGRISLVKLHQKPK